MLTRAVTSNHHLFASYARAFARRFESEFNPARIVAAPAHDPEIALSDLMAALHPRLPLTAEPGLPVLPDETLTHYGELYRQFVAPWREIKGAVIPTFFQFVLWQERSASDEPGSRGCRQ